MIRRPLLSLLLLGLLAAGLYWLAAPYLAFRAVRSAALHKDVQALSELVDYDAVRTGLRYQLHPTGAERTPPASVLADPLGAMRRALEPALTPQDDVNRYLTPEALANLVEGRAATAPPPPPSDKEPPLRLPALVYWGTERYRFAVKDPADAARRTVFTFKRKAWFDWTLAAIELPSP